MTALIIYTNQHIRHVLVPSNDAKYWMDKANQWLSPDHHVSIPLKDYNASQPKPFAEKGLKI